MEDDDASRRRWSQTLAAAAARAYESSHGAVGSEPARGVRLSLAPRAAVVAAAVVVIVAAVAWWTLRAGPPVPVPVEPLSSSAPMAELVVDVSGAVLTPGIVRLPGGSRVVDAIAAAGGALPGAALDGLNLARLVRDGEQVLVPRQGEAASSALINLNTADASRLEDLPGVGPVLAARILADRERNGPFASVEDLRRVSGVGAAIVDALAGIATV